MKRIARVSVFSIVDHGLLHRMASTESAAQLSKVRWGTIPVISGTGIYIAMDKGTSNRRELRSRSRISEIRHPIESVALGRRGCRTGRLWSGYH